MEQNKKLSLQEEVKKEAKRIEQEIADNPELADITLSQKTDKELLEKIQIIEKLRATRIENGENTVETSEEIMPDFSVSTNDESAKLDDILSEEDREALRLGRELLKNKEKNLHEVDTNIHRHLNGGDDTGKKKSRAVFRLPRKRRFVVALVAVMVLVVGTGVTSVGSKSYLKVLWEKVHGGQAMQVMNVEDMDTKETEDGEELAIYSEIRDQLGVSAIRFGYKPAGMNIEKYQMDKEQGRARIFYLYNGELIRYIIYLNDSDSSLSQKEADEAVNEYIVETEKQKITVKEYSVNNSENLRRIADFEYQGVKYQLKGIMDKELFDNMLKKLIYI